MTLVAEAVVEGGCQLNRNCYGFEISREFTTRAVNEMLCSYITKTNIKQGAAV